MELVPKNFELHMNKLVQYCSYYNNQLLYLTYIGLLESTGQLE